MFAPGTKIRGYTVERALDAPAGWHELVARDDAGTAVLLRVPPDLDGSERIRGEAALAKKHKVEGLLASLDLVEHAGWPVQVLAYVEGLTLEALQVSAGKLPPEAVCRIGRQIALALVALHERAGVAHGALAADRILIDTGGNARLVDVGCARPMGPKRLQSPERRKSVGSPSAPDDLWALGVILADSLVGGALDPAADLPAFTAQLQSAAVPDRLADALRALVASLGARLTNASAAVRVFTDLEKKLGDGALTLRKAVQDAKAPTRTRKPEGPGPATIPDAPERPFAALMKDLVGDPSTDPNDSPITIDQDQTNPSNPRTVEMTPEKVLDVLQMQRMSKLAEEAARRMSGPVVAPRTDVDRELPKETVDEFPAIGPPIGPRDIHEEVTASDPNAQPRRAPPQSARAPQPAPTVPTAPRPVAPDPHALDDAERAAVGTPMGPKAIAAVIVALVVLGVLWLALRG